MKTIEQIARELGDDWDTTLPEDKVFIENVAKAYLSAWLEQQSQEPVAYMAPSGTCVTAEDVSYTPNWTDYYTIPLYAAPPAKVDQQPQEPVAWASGHLRYAFERTKRYIPLSVEVSLVNLGWENQLPLFLAPQLVIPEGYVLVPKEPTDEMLSAGRNTECTVSEEDCTEDYCLVYKAMIAAAQGGKE